MSKHTDTDKYKSVDERFDKISRGGEDWCGCFEGDLNNTFSKQQAIVKSFLHQELDRAREESYYMGKVDEVIKIRSWLVNYAKGSRKTIIGIREHLDLLLKDSKTIGRDSVKQNLSSEEITKRQEEIYNKFGIKF